MFTGINDSLLLIALAMGYLVLYFAHREEKGMQFAGYIIGFTIIILAIGYIALNCWMYSWARCPMKAKFYKPTAAYGKMIQPWLPKELPQNP